MRFVIVSIVLLGFLGGMVGGSMMYHLTSEKQKCEVTR